MSTTPWRCILLLSTHLYLGLPSGVFHSGFPTVIMYWYAFITYPLHATYPTCLTLIIFDVKKVKLPLCLTKYHTLKTYVGVEV